MCSINQIHLLTYVLSPSVSFRLGYFVISLIQTVWYCSDVGLIVYLSMYVRKTWIISLLASPVTIPVSTAVFTIPEKLRRSGILN